MPGASAGEDGQASRLVPPSLPQVARSRRWPRRSPAASRGRVHCLSTDRFSQFVDYLCYGLPPRQRGASVPRMCGFGCRDYRVRDQLGIVKHWYVPNVIEHDEPCPGDHFLGTGAVDADREDAVLLRPGQRDRAGRGIEKFQLRCVLDRVLKNRAAKGVVGGVDKIGSAQPVPVDRNIVHCPAPEPAGVSQQGEQPTRPARITHRCTQCVPDPDHVIPVAIPGTRRRKCTHGLGPPAPCQLEGNPTTRRVAGQMRLVQAQLVENLLAVIDPVPEGRWSFVGDPSSVPEPHRRNHVIAGGQRRDDTAPHPIGLKYAV